MADDDVSIGEVYRIVVKIEANMVSKETNDETVRGLRDADERQMKAIIALDGKFTEAEKDIKSAGRAKVNIWIAAGIALLGSAAMKLWPGP